MVLILFYFRIYSRLNEYVQQLIVESVAIAGHIRTVFPPLYHLGNAMTGQSWASLAFFLLCTVGPFLLVYWILVRSFARIATARRSLGTVKYKEHALKVHSPLTALVQKELARFTSTPMYMLNASMGLLLSLIGSGFLLFKGRDVLEGITSIPELSTFVAPLMTVILCLLAGMNTISAPSLSLEGRTLWLPQSLPVKGSQVLLSKAYLHMIISLPGAILAALVVVFVCHMGILDAMLCFLVPVLMHIFQALLGVVTNIRFHRFDWINETVAVKQSISVMIGMCANFGVLAAWIVLYIFVFSKYLSAQLYLGVFGIFIAAICVILFRYLVGKGSEKFFTMG